MSTFNELKKNLKKDFSSHKKIKVALLGDTATQFLKQAIRGTGFEQGFDIDIWEANFNQIERQVFDPSSELFEFNPEVIIIFHSAHKLLDKYNKLKLTLQNNLANTQLELVRNIVIIINSQLKSKIIYYNYTEINDSVFGNYANKIESSFLFQLRKLNFELMVFATSISAIFLLFKITQVKSISFSHQFISTLK